MKHLTSALLVFVIILTFSCAQKKDKVRVSGAMVTKDINVSNFHSIGMNVGAKVFITQGDFKVSAKGKSDLIDLIETDVRKGSWNIEFSKRVSNYEGKLEIYISMPDVKGISIAGSGDIIGKSNFDGLGNTSFNINGSGSISFSGSADKVKISIAGSGDMDLVNLKAKDVKVSIAGSGDANVHASENLKVSIAGSGDVSYKGSPRVKSSIAGSGDINSI
ncbi:MAG: DUF2807 domain-containing protein [Saprospiraceae bacterium]|nr:DUF2807 domain-containing protein [Saprospiraceae bacterium]